MSGFTVMMEYFTIGSRGFKGSRGFRGSRGSKGSKGLRDVDMSPFQQQALSAPVNRI